MKYTRKDESDTKIQLAVTVDDKDLKDIRKFTVAKLAHQVKVPGFRAGKVPPAVAEKHLDAATVASQLIEDAVNKFVIDVINAEQVQPLDRPHVEIDDFKPDEQLVFTATLEILPKIKLGDYKKLKAASEKVTITAKDVDEVIERMRLGMAEKEEVKRAAKDGDEVWIDFEGTDEKGQPVAGAAGKDYPLRLGSNTFIPGFEEGLVGKKVGDKFDLPLTFPKDYHHAPLAGVKIAFAVTVNKVNEVKSPKVDDEFAAKCGPFTTVAELKADIKRELTAQKEQTAADKLKDQLVEQLVKVSTIPVPDVLIEDQMNMIERDTIQNLLYRGQTIEAFLEEQKLTREQWRDKELKDAAQRRVQVGLALAELSKVEKIEVTKEELDARQQDLFSQHSDPQLRAQLDTPEARRDLANRVLTEKTVDRLVDLNTPSKKP